MTGRRPRHQIRRGFTLLELIVVLVVSGLIMLALSQGLRLGLVGLDLQARALNARGELDNIDRLLRTLIQSADPGQGSGQGQGPGGAAPLRAESHRFRFQGELPSAAVAVTRRAILDLAVINHQLVLRWQPYRHEADIDPPPSDQVVLLDHVNQLDLSYWQAGGWHETLTEGQWPTLVRVQLRFPRGDARHWPDLIVPIRRDPG